MDGIIICSGAPRTGTSLCMQTLDLLGVPMGVPKFIPEHDNIRDFNKNGFYEINSTEGVTDKRYSGKAIKLFGIQLYKTPKELIGKLIYIDRNKEEAIKSYDKIRKFLPPVGYSSEAIYDANKYYIEQSIDENTMRITLEEVKKNPINFVSDLINYLQIYVNDKQINQAIKNIN